MSHPSTTATLLANPEDAYFKQALDMFTRDDALDEILPRFKMRAEERARHIKQDRSSNVWDYNEEARAWDLVSRLSRSLATGCELEDVDSQVPDGRTEILRIDDMLAEESDLQLGRRLIKSKPELRWLRGVLDWLECNVDRERLDKVYMWKTKQMWSRTLEREHGTGAPLDPDSVAKQEIRLENLDQEEEQHLLYGLWLLLRTGRLGWASEVRGIGYQDTQQEMEWQYEKARQELLCDDPNVDPTGEQVKEKMAQMQEPLYWYLHQVDLNEREEQARQALAEVGKEPTEENLKETMAMLDPYGRRAVERLCVIWGQPWRAATLGGGDLSHDPVLSGYNLGFDPVPTLPESGNRRLRMLWRSMCLQTAAQAAQAAGALGSGSVGAELAIAPSYEPRRHHKEHPAAAYESGLYGVLGFEPRRAQLVCQCWEDELFCEAKSMFEAKVEYAIARERERLGRHAPVSVPDPAVAQAEAVCLRKSLHDVAQYPDSSQNFADSPLAWVERCLIRGDFEKLFRMLQQMVHPQAPQHGWSTHLLRFGVHLSLVLRGARMQVCGPTLPGWPEPDQVDPAEGRRDVELCDFLLKRYADYLVSSGQQHLAASYIVLLSSRQEVADGLEALFQGLTDLEGMQLQDEHMEIALQAMENRDAWSCDQTDVGPSREMILEVAHRVASPIPGRQKPLYAIKWLCVYPEHRFHAVAIANFIIRQLISQPRPMYEDAMTVITYLPDRIRFLRPGCEEYEEWRAVEEDHSLLVNELRFWWEFLAAQDDFKFVRGYHSRIEQARSLHKNSNEVVLNTVLEGFDSGQVAVRGESAVRHFGVCLKLLPARVSDPTDPNQDLLARLVYPILTNLYWLLVQLLPSLVPQKQKEFLEEAVQLAVLITKDDMGGERKVYEHLSQQDLQSFVMLMAIAQTELLKYHDQVHPKSWQEYARETQVEREDMVYQ
eukprot:TRINITY_DN1271_c0_g1_i5.p1 TRINITY_DN1271_c0_g1~~TRINITY_DN1271_c0_g1_i5.p1  ORF type:complete len:943 (-),score=244.17 TRINITY_DN1271_c0_g1_i5:344-3172(-)